MIKTIYENIYKIYTNLQTPKLSRWRFSQWLSSGIWCFVSQQTVTATSKKLAATIFIWQGFDFSYTVIHENKLIQITILTLLQSEVHLHEVCPETFDSRIPAFQQKYFALFYAEYLIFLYQK
jgi:hypothetical protein